MDCHRSLVYSRERQFFVVGYCKKAALVSWQPSCFKVTQLYSALNENRTINYNATLSSLLILTSPCVLTCAPTAHNNGTILGNTANVVIDWPDKGNVIVCTTLNCVEPCAGGGVYTTKGGSDEKNGDE